MNTCYLCKGMEENCNHLLLWCPVVYKPWTTVYSTLGISWVPADSVRDEIWVWKGLECKRGNKRKLSHLLFSGLYGRREIKGLLRGLMMLMVMIYSRIDDFRLLVFY